MGSARATIGLVVLAAAVHAADCPVLVPSIAVGGACEGQEDGADRPATTIAHAAAFVTAARLAGCPRARLLGAARHRLRRARAQVRRGVRRALVDGACASQLRLQIADVAAQLRLVRGQPR